MSASPLDLPARPSLEQLRKQAKERLREMPGAQLADAQFALAHEYGFDSWPKLVRHVEALAAPAVGQHERIARDMVAVHRDRDEAAAARLNDLFHSSLTIDQIRDFIRQRLWPLPDGQARLARFSLPDARLLVAHLYGFDTWDSLISATLMDGQNETTSGIGTTPPFYSIDEARGIIAPQQPMSARDWNVLIGIIKERQLTGLDANHMMDDEAMAKLASLDQITVLKLHGSDRLTDDGARHLARFERLEELELGGWKSPLTDDALASLRHLPRLRTIGASWWRRVTDAGLGEHLAGCAQLEDINMMGTAAGDAFIGALSGTSALRRLVAGTAVSDVGLARLRDFPMFAAWHGGEPSYGLMEFLAGPTYVSVEGTFTPSGIHALQALHGLFALNLKWKPGALDSRVLALLGPLERLGFLGIEGDTCDDDAMCAIGSLPQLRMLLAQEPVATDAGFEGLARSRTLEYIWGRECPNLHGRGFEALASIPPMRGLAVSCKCVGDSSLAAIAKMPHLDSLMPMDVTDDGFRHIARCRGLQHLWCMYCPAMSDAATEHIAGLALKSYYVGGTTITNKSLVLLGRMRSLERVELQYCQGITDEGVRHLAQLPHLREVIVVGSRTVTRAGMSVFPPRVRASYATL